MSNFIVYDDYKSFITVDRLEQLIKNDKSILTDAELYAASTIEDALFERYEIGQELAKVGANRNRTLKMWAIYLALYIIYQRLPESMIPKSVIKNHDDTIDNLEMVTAGKKSINIAVKLGPDLDGDGIPDPETVRRWGSSKKRTHLL